MIFLPYLGRNYMGWKKEAAAKKNKEKNGYVEMLSMQKPAMLAGFVLL
jgi:hypothetical protein